MFAIAFDLIESAADRHHPKTLAQAYEDVRGVLAIQGFDRIRDSFYVSRSEDLTGLLSAVMALKALPWFPPSVRDIRAFKIEQWSDFTAMVKA